MLFELEFRHPWFRPTCCNTNWNDYREIEEVPIGQTNRQRENNSDENENFHRSQFSYTEERNERRLQRRTESPTNRGRNGVLTDMPPHVISD